MSVTIKNGITPNINSRTGVSSTTVDSLSPGTPIGTYHLSDNTNFYEPQRTNNFEFVITDIDGIMRAGMEGTEASNIRTIKNAQEIIRLSVVSSSVPHFDQNVIEIRRGNSVLKYAGTPTFQSGSLVINDYIGADSKSVLQAWQNLSYNVKTEKVGLVTDYKKDAYLIEYTPDYQEVRRWRLHGCWVSKLQENEYNHDGNDKHQITATIEYDRAEIDMSDTL